MTRFSWGSRSPKWLSNSDILQIPLKIHRLFYPERFYWSVPGFMLFSCLLLLAPACKQPDLGLEVQNPSDAVNLLRMNDLSVRTSLEREDSVRTDELSLNLLGAYNDPLLGAMRASFYTQLRPSASNISFGEDFSVDSLVLVLPFRGYYGDLTKLNGLQKFTVYRVTQDFAQSSVYFSNDSLTIESTPIGQTGFIVPILTDSAIVTGKKEVPQLRIHLNTAIAQEIQNNASALVDGDAFVQLFKGIYVKSETRNALPGEGAMLDFSLLSGARMDLFYKNSTNDSLRTSFSVNENCTRFTRFNHVYSEQVLNMISTPALADERTYVQTMAGLRTRIDIPNLRSWQAGRNILVNEARIIVPVNFNDFGVYLPNPQLNMITKGEDGTLETTPDLLIGDSWAGGTYDAVNKEYIFNVSRYIQKILTDLTVDRGLFIQSTGTGVSSYRVPLNGGASAERPVRFELLYQVLPQ
jgi:hypothetical protein